MQKRSILNSANKKSDIVRLRLNTGYARVSFFANRVDGLNVLRTMARCIVWFFVVVRFVAPGHSVCAEDSYDVVVYGGTSGGVAAAVQVARMNKTVMLIEPSNHLGGLTSGGLGATDIGNKAAIGGISREFYQQVKKHYSQPEAWTWQKKGEYKSYRNPDGSDDAMWTFEPHVAEKIFREMLRLNNVRFVMNERLDLRRGVIKNGKAIVEIRMESGRSYRAKRFIDATYEGDLLGTAGVSYHVGRESNDTYRETLNGIQTKNATKHQFVPNVSAYVVAGDATSGLLPGVAAKGSGGQDGSGDHRVQAYCFRMCNTTHPANRIPFEKPDDYNELNYELLLRNFESGAKIAPWHPINMPNHKTDTNNNGGFSTDFIGMSYAWPEADYATRAKIYQQHLSYQKGLMWTLANHPRVPKAIRDEFSRWGNCRDEFVENNGWPHQLYVREGRRMVGALVMTQHHCQGKETVSDAVGLAAYTMDSHNVQRYVDEEGNARNEGDVQVGGFPPYPISYRSIIPKASECSNLLVPIALSASHIAYGSIRMEPVFMVLGQSAATAACQSIENDKTVQQIDYQSLKRRLVTDGQVLSWSQN